MSKFDNKLETIFNVKNRNDQISAKITSFNNKLLHIFYVSYIYQQIQAYFKTSNLSLSQIQNNKNNCKTI